MLIALSGVAVPLVGGMLVYMGFGFGTPDTRLYEGIFMGTVLAATSVSITVQALKEMGHLKGKVGTTILSAAILDDIIGIILLTVVIGFKSPDVSPVDVCIKTILFFVLAIVLGLHFTSSLNGSASTGLIQEEFRFSDLFFVLRQLIVRKNSLVLPILQVLM